MSFLSLFFKKALYQPLFNGLIFLYNIVPYHDLGIAIILLTVIIRLVLYPLNQKAIKSQKALADLQPQIKDIQTKEKDKVKQSQALMELYKKNGVHPASGCLPLLIQLPVLFALYAAFRNGLDPNQLGMVYSFLGRPEAINAKFLGLVNLAEPNYIMAVSMGALTYVQSKMMAGVQSKNSAAVNDFGATMNKQMLYFMPFLMMVVAWKLPAALTLYLVATTIFGIVQQYFVIKKNGKRNNGEN